MKLMLCTDDGELLDLVDVTAADWTMVTMNSTAALTLLCSLEPRMAAQIESQSLGRHRARERTGG